MATPFFPIISLRGFFQMLKGSLLRSQWSDLAEFLTAVIVFSIITLSVAMGISSCIWPNFKLIQALMYVIITCKYEMDPIKNSREKVATPFFP